ncbi:MAG: hypothetical protein C4558_07375 [Dehalococcoidia bacterium]|nr:MAG: hypothetical protein C4558_07375 [Dehalococcoidia bacterium]
MAYILVTGWLRRRIDDIRRNHGLEHATVAVLFARHGPQRLAGRATSDGFYIIGRVDDVTLRSCAEEALARMQRGEASLAVSPHCGTNIAVTGAVTAAATMAALARGPRDGIRDRFGNAFTAAMLGVVLAQPLGRLVQTRLTTRADLHGFELVGIRTLFPGMRKVLTRHAV